MKRWTAKLDEHTCQTCRDEHGGMVPPDVYAPHRGCEAERGCQCGTEPTLAVELFEGEAVARLAWIDRFRVLFGKPLLITCALVAGYFDSDRSVQIGPHQWAVGVQPLLRRPSWLRWPRTWPRWLYPPRWISVTCPSCDGSGAWQDNVCGVCHTRGYVPPPWLRFGPWRRIGDTLEQESSP